MILCKDILDHVCGQTSVNFAVHRHNRSQATGAYATAGFQRELTVCGTLSAGNSQNFLQFLVNLAGALYLASGTKTYRDIVFSLGIQGEK